MFESSGGWVKWLPIPLVIIILVYLYTISPESTPVVSFQGEDYSNWSRYTGDYSDHIKGRFIGVVGERLVEQNRWNRLSGVFDGECFRDGEAVRCHLNVSGGGYSGSAPVGVVGAGNSVDVNFTGTALGWQVSGYVLPVNQYVAPADKTFSWDNLLIIGVVGAAAFILWKTQSGRRYVLDDASIAQKLRKYLPDSFSKSLLRVEEFHRWPESGYPEKCNIYFLLKEPYGLPCLCRYDFLTGVFIDFKFGCSHAEYRQFMNPAIKLVQEKESKESSKAEKKEAKE